MKNIRLYALLVLLLMAGRVTMQAQEYPQDLEVIYRSDNVRVTSVYCIDENAFLAFAATDSGSRALMKITYEGEILDSISLPDNRLELWRHANFMNGKLRYVSFRLDDNDTLPLLCVVDIDPDGLSLTYTGYNWDGSDFNHPSVTQFYTNMIYPVFSKDGSLTLSYPVDSLWMIDQKESMHLVKFNNEGNIIKERVFRDYKASLTNFFFSAPDSLGFRFILMNERYDFDCYTLDADLNTISVADSVGRVHYSNQNMSGWLYAISNDVCSMRFNPYNGRTYSVGSEDAWEYQDEKTNVIMTAYDEDFNLVNWTFGIINPYRKDEGYGMSFSPNGEVYMLGWMDLPLFKGTGQTESEGYYNVYVGLMDEDLNKRSEIYFKPDLSLAPNTISACPAGGCILSCFRGKDSGSTDYCVYRITPKDFLNVEEAHSHGFAVATAYPNPGRDVLNIRTALENAHLEVFDLNGRLMHSQRITDNVTTIDAAAWPSGVYVWKVYTNQAGPSTGSGTLVETGKWIKE